jgi:hypothetical protein
MEYRIELTSALRQSAGRMVGQNRAFASYLGEHIGEYRVPICEAARHLLAKGLAAESDTITTFRDGVPCMTGNVGALAKLTVIENEKVGPIWGKWRPMPEGALRLYGERTDALEALAA